ncbi:MAG TPA: glutamate--tRNA ligase family protein [Chitinophagaceae bacterium]|nr:glutamate--tRNA ligase family protein [Chitinophagaceae bacterium]
MVQTGISFHKTRIAPTPTGYLHLGNVYSFALTAALAQKYNAQILLRIDDLDHQRVNSAYVQDIFDTLEFLGIPWHEGPRNMQELEQEYSQHRRLHLYRQALQQLQNAGAVFACNCSRTTVLQNNAAGIYPGACLHRQLPFTNNAWRLDTSSPLMLAVKTLEGKTIQEPLPPEMQYFVVKKKDGFPAYQLASLVDDLYFNVDFVVRGADLWASTLAQQYLATKLQRPAFGNITFHHHPLLSSPDGNKLSKSAGSTSVQYLRKQGKTAADIYALAGNLAGVGAIKSWKDILE